MKNNAFGISALLFTAVVDAADASAATPAAPLKTKKVQHTLTADERTKAQIMELAQEFHGFNVSDPEKKKFLTSEEIVGILFKVATDRRFITEYVMNEDGSDYIYDTDGNAETVQVDLIEREAEKVIAARAGNTAKVKVSAIKSQLAVAEAALMALGWTKEGGVLTPPATVPAETAGE